MHTEPIRNGFKRNSYAAKFVQSLMCKYMSNNLSSFHSFIINDKHVSCLPYVDGRIYVPFCSRSGMPSWQSQRYRPTTSSARRPPNGSGTRHVSSRTPKSLAMTWEASWYSSAGSRVWRATWLLSRLR